MTQYTTWFPSSFYQRFANSSGRLPLPKNFHPLIITFYLNVNLLNRIDESVKLLDYREIVGQKPYSRDLETFLGQVWSRHEYILRMQDFSVEVYRSCMVDLSVGRVQHMFSGRFFEDRGKLSCWGKSWNFMIIFQKSH